MSKRQIDMLDRNSLINLGVRLQVKGYKNFFNSPYLKKSKIKELIQEKLKEYKSLKRSNSLNILPTITNNNIPITKPK